VPIDKSLEPVLKTFDQAGEGTIYHQEYYVCPQGAVAVEAFQALAGAFTTTNALYPVSLPVCIKHDSSDHPRL
jgi:hypothetical protein